MIGIRTNVLYNSFDYYVQYLANAILGGFMNSRLFQIVREKHNLSYSVYSFLRPLDKCLFIYAGVDNQKVEKTLQVIEDILENLRTNTVKRKELDLFKSLLKNALKEADDNQYNQIERAFSCQVTNKNFDLDSTLEFLNRVTSEDVQRFFNQIKVDTIFVLRGTKNETKN